MNKTIVLGVLVAVVASILISVLFGLKSDPRDVCKDLAEDEVCVCTDDIRTSTCGVEKLVN